MIISILYPIATAIAATIYLKQSNHVRCTRVVNINDTIQFIKRKLGYPSVSLELSDNDIADIIKYETLLLFEQYIPDVGRIMINKYSKKHRIKKNLYWVIDPNDREVFAVQSVEPEQSELLAHGYPWTAPIISYQQVPDHLTRLAESHLAMQYGKSLRWWQESVANQVWIFSDDSISGRYSISYTRSHAPDLSSVSREYAIDFNNIALAYTMMTIGQIRSKYSTIGTPLGDIQINNELYTQGSEILNTTVEKLDKIKPIFTQVIVQ